MHPLITSVEVFVVNVLAAEQEEMSRRFADPHDDRFDGVGYRSTPDGLVYLDGALAHIECRRQTLHEAGDHTIVLSRVVGGDAREGRPLVYFRGSYTALR
jgi:flavin reductase (DIM6/NTAB) family NADH-FMN oxidoreductase RutF